MTVDLKVVVPLRVPPTEAVTLTRELSEGVASGDYVEIAAVARRRDGSCDTLWTSSSDLMHMLAIVTRLQHNLQKRLDSAANTINLD